MKIAFEFFCEKAGIINSQVNELLDEINEFINENDDIGDIDYLQQLVYLLENIEGQWLDIYELQEDYAQ